MYTYLSRIFYKIREGHLKCSSEVYDLNNKNQFIHITNYSVQKHSNNFQKYEFGNEVSFSDFQVILIYETEIFRFNIS